MERVKSFNSYIDKDMLLNKMRHFLEPCTHSKNIIKIESDLANYATKSDLKMHRCWDIDIC